jgi:sporulation protein YlmC with PRC-barrel domain
MKKQLLSITAFCAALLVMGAQAQSSSDQTTSPGTSGSSDSSSSYSGQSGTSRHHYGATGRMGQQEIRASQLMGANLTGSSGETLGTISDTIINPASGRIDFAVISLNSSGSSSGSSTTPGGASSGSSATPGSSSSSGSSGSSSLGSSSSSGGSTSSGGSFSGLSSTSGSSLSSAGGKQVAVPWMLLRPSSSASSSSSTTGVTSGQQSFVFSGDASKLQSAPNFDPNTDLTQPGWRQSVFSYFGLSSGGTATGAAETPGGTSSSSGGSSSPGSSSSGSSSSGK